MAGLYIHIPYCHSKCAYCDFYSTPNVKSMEQYIDALKREIVLRISELNEPIRTVYIGGGTPSLLPISLLKSIVVEVSKYIDIDGLEEFTIEANPEDITQEWIDAITQLGINRVSMGIQSFNDAELNEINRRHTAQMALDAVNLLRESGINQISGDLIYGLPGQDIDSWKYSLDLLLSLQLPHFSAYLLSYEEGTKLYARLMAGKVEEASEELANEMYKYLITRAHDEGYVHYEISNFSKTNCEAIHNTNYWRDLPYLGIGVSAHSFDGQCRRVNPPNIKNYVSHLLAGNCVFEIEEENAQNRHNDYIIVALRTAKGIDLEHYNRTYNYDILDIARPYIEEGKMVLTNTHLAIAEDYMLISDRIMLDFIV